MINEKPPRSGGFLNYIHLLHEEGSIAIAGDALPEAVVEMELVAIDSAFKTVIAYEAGELLFQAAQGKIMGRKKGKTGILQQLANELFGSVCLIIRIGASQYLIDEHQGRGIFLYTMNDALQLFQLRHKIGGMLLQGVADPQGCKELHRREGKGCCANGRSTLRQQQVDSRRSQECGLS